MLLLIWKDVKNVISDKKILTVILLMPVILMSILGFSLGSAFSGGEGSGIRNFQVAIIKEYDLESELKAFESTLEDFNFVKIESIPNPEVVFFDDFLGSREIKNIMTYDIVDRTDGMKLLEEDKISAIIILPKDFIYDTMMNFTYTRNKVSIEVIKNSGRQTSADIAEQVIGQYLNMLNRMIIRRLTIQPYLMKLGSDSLPDLPMEDLLLPVDNLNLSLTVKEVTGRDSWSSFQYYSVAMMAMFSLYVTGFGGRALIEEKDTHTLKRLKVAGKSLEQLVLSNFIRIIIIVVIQSVLMILYSSLVLKVDYGNLVNMIMPIFLSAVSVGTLGMLISVITLVSGSYTFANVFEYGIVNLMALVGGSFVPVQILPKVFQKAGMFSINGNTLGLYLNAIAGEPMSGNYKYLINLFVMDILFAGTGWTILRISKNKGGLVV